MKNLILIAFLLTRSVLALNYVDQAYLGASARNYIANGGAERGRSGWATYADAAATSPVDCTGGSPSSTWTTSGTTPLSGQNSFIWTHSANNRQGEGASYAFSIDKSDQARVHAITFDFEVASGTFVAGVNPPATAVDSDLEVYIYDVTNSLVIQPSNYKLLQNSGQAKYTGTFQTASNSQSYRLCLHAATTSTSAHTIRIDSIKLGPNSTITGPPVTDWKSYTPTLSSGWGTVSNNTGYYRRVGDTLEVIAFFTPGTVAAAIASISLPIGVSIDSSKLTQNNSTGAPGDIVGHWGQGTSVNTGFMILAPSTSTTVVYFGDKLSNSAKLTPQNGSTIAANSVDTDCTFKVPIAGWASNVALGSDNDGRILSLLYTGNAGESLTANVTNIPFATKNHDTHSSWNGSLFTAPTPGIYQIVGSWISSTNSTPDTDLYVNGSKVLGSIGREITSDDHHFFRANWKLNAGDTMSIRSNGNLTASNQTYHVIAINKITGPAQIASSELIAARSYATSTVISSSVAPINWTTSDYDTHGAMSAGRSYFCPAAGKYKVSVRLALTAASAAAGNAVNLQLQKNGAIVTENAPLYQSTQILFPIAIDDIVSCNAGDYLTVYASSAATTPSITSSNTKNYFSISRLGN